MKSPTERKVYKYKENWMAPLLSNFLASVNFMHHSSKYIE